MFKQNFSEVARNASGIGALVLKDVGEQFAARMWDLFVELIEETPQYTGTAAASWNMTVAGYSTGASFSEGYRKHTLAKGESPLSKGHGKAVNEAKEASAGVKEAIPKFYTTGDIMVWNNAPSMKHAELGPLRPINEPTFVYSKFIAKVQAMSFEVIGNHNV